MATVRAVLYYREGYNLLLILNCRGQFPLITTTFVCKTYLANLNRRERGGVSSGLMCKLTPRKLCDSMTEEGRALLTLGIGFYFRMSYLCKYRYERVRTLRVLLVKYVILSSPRRNSMPPNAPSIYFLYLLLLGSC